MARWLKLLMNLQDRFEDSERGFQTYATRLPYASISELVNHAIPRKIFFRHAKKCFRSLTVSERDGYLFLWRSLKYHWDLFKHSPSGVNPPTNPRPRDSFHKQNPSSIRAITKNGRYWGPFFVQPRVGKGGEVVSIYKFRTMSAFRPPDAELQQDIQLGKKCRWRTRWFLGTYDV